MKGSQIMDNLKMTITDDMDKYNAESERKPAVLGEVNFGNAYCLDVAALENLCKCLFALFPNDLVKLDISYSVGNH